MIYFKILGLVILFLNLPLVFGGIRDFVIQKLNVTVEKGERITQKYGRFESWLTYPIILGLLILIQLTHNIVPGHDFTLNIFSSLHLFLATVRSLIVFVIGLIYTPVVVTNLILFLLKYFFSVVSIASKTVRNGVFGLISYILSFSFLSYYIYNYQDLAAINPTLKVLILAIIFSIPFIAQVISFLREIGIKNEGIVFSIKTIAIELIKLVTGILSSVILAFMLFYQYNNIFIFDREIVDWQGDLPCQINMVNFLYIDDILMGDRISNGVFRRDSIKSFSSDFREINDRSISLSFKTSGPAEYARVMAHLLEKKDSSSNLIGSYSAGGYHLEHGQFTIDFSIDSLRKLKMDTVLNCKLLLSLAPGGYDFTFDGKPWPNHFIVKDLELLIKKNSDSTVVYNLSSKNKAWDVLKCDFKPIKDNEVDKSSD